MSKETLDVILGTPKILHTMLRLLAGKYSDTENETNTSFLKVYKLEVYVHHKLFLPLF